MSELRLLRTDSPRLPVEEDIEIGIGTEEETGIKEETEKGVEEETGIGIEEISEEKEKGKGEEEIRSWSERKSLLNNIQFINYFWDPQKYPNPKVLCLGCSPGINIKILSDLFPEITFYCYDPKPFSIEKTEKVIVYRKFFEEKDALFWSYQTGGIFLISNIKSVDGKLVSRKENEAAVRKDSLDQRSWIEIISPVSSLIKFRLPGTKIWREMMRENYIGRFVPPFPENLNLLYYLDGYLFLQPWNKKDSNGTKMVVEGKGRNKIWDIEEQEEKMNYYNKIVRTSEQDYFFDFDSFLEFSILGDYIEKQERDEFSDVKVLSQYISDSLKPGTYWPLTKR